MSFENNDTIAPGFSMSFWDAVGLGRINGWSYIEKFGENLGIDTTTDPEDIWSQGGLYVFSTTEDIDSISSSSATDDQEITVEGLDLGCCPVVQTVTLDGQNRVALDTPLYRCYRAYNSDSTALAGDVYIYVNGAITDGVPDTAAGIKAKITIGSGQTEMCIYTIPSGKTGYFIGGYVSKSRAIASVADFTSRVITDGGVERVLIRISTTSSWQYKYPIPIALAARTDVFLRCETVSANGTGVSGGFTIALKDN